MKLQEQSIKQYETECDGEKKYLGFIKRQRYKFFFFFFFIIKYQNDVVLELILKLTSGSNGVVLVL